MQNERKPTTVSKTKQVGEAKPLWGWVERAAWTGRMLKALETGVKGFHERGLFSLHAASVSAIQSSRR